MTLATAGAGQKGAQTPPCYHISRHPLSWTHNRRTQASPAAPSTRTFKLAITRALADIPTYGELEAAMVISTDKNQAAVQRIDGSTVTLRLQQTQWARPYISADRRGPVPLSMQDILRSGDIIRLRREGANWLLSQLPEIQGALVALDPANGAVRALVGGYDFYRNPI